MTRDFSHVRFISAGAGSGKTYRLTEELQRALVEGGVEPSGVIGTTFTVKAAGELRERVRERLIQAGRPELAEQTAQALIGTVHSVCERLLKRFAFELGLSPELHVASLEDCGALFKQALDGASAATLRGMNAIAWRLGIEDWGNDVKKLADRARDNDIAPSALVEMGRNSANELLAFFPKPQNGDWDAQLLSTVQNALERIDLSVDTTKGTAKYVARLNTAVYQLRRAPCPWSVWLQLSEAEATKKSDAIAAAVRAAGAAYDRHPRFHEDLRLYIQGVYSIAAEALERFQDIKTERGLIDFPDMEQLTLRALEQPVVRDRLENELELLLVDEFQDTNPMQLAIFMKLAELADDVIFVGDVKQAIYAFRGCDPDLVFETLKALAKGGSEADVLPHSWRSRPALVHYINAVFCQAFDGEIPAKHVALAPKRSEQTEEPAVLCWQTDGNKAMQAAALAKEIVALVHSGFRVVDPESDETRPVRWGDIAVLAASNANVEEAAKALRAAHVPMKMTLLGLQTVPEICLAKACLRRLNDVTDTLATAEVIAMSDCSEPEVWLADRLRWLANEGDGYAWAENTHPIIAKLKVLRNQIGTQSPVEVVARVLNYIGIREVVTAWGPNAIKAMQRQRNLDALLNLAVEYERHCDAQHVAATLTGFLFWLEHPHSAELDLQPVVTTGDAVHVLTYHKAKGLEWPVVINTDLNFSWRSRLWDVRVDGKGDRFNLREPLSDRVIKYWPSIFAKTSGIPVLDKILASDIGMRCRTAGHAENRRLAYVGLTRARDAIVLAVPPGNPRADAWLHAFQGDYLLPTGETLALPNGEKIATRPASVTTLAVGADPVSFEPRRFSERPLLVGAERESVNPSAAHPLANATVTEVVDLKDRIPVHGGDMAVIGAALHALIASEFVNPRRDDAAHRARALLDGYGVAPYVDAEAVLAAAARLRAWIESRFAPIRILSEYPVEHRLADGRVVRGWIDLLLETNDGWTVIDHKSSPRPRSEWQDEALGHSGQLSVYRQVLEASGKRVSGCWIHFPVSGGVVALSTRDSSNPAR